MNMRKIICFPLNEYLLVVRDRNTYVIIKIA